VQYETIASILSDATVANPANATAAVPLTGVTCQYTNGVRYQSNFGNTSVAQLPGNGMLLDGDYVFVAAARKGMRVASTLIFLEVTSNLPTGSYQVDITPAIIRQKVLHNERLALLGSVNSQNLVRRHHYHLRRHHLCPSVACLMYKIII
jgi:hypothetical protein